MKDSETTLVEEEDVYLKTNEFLWFLNNYFKISSSEAFIFLISGYTNTDCTHEVIDFVNKRNIKKVYVFIEDVFRVYKHLDGEWLQTWPLEDPTIEWWIPELEIVSTVRTSTKNTEYEIYHCEHNVDFISEKYNLDIKYFDIFLHMWITMAVKWGINDQYPEFNSNFKYKVSCFNLRQDYHRYFMASLLSTESDVLLSLNNKYSNVKLTTSRALPIEKFNFSIKKQIEENINKLDFNQLVIDGNVSTLSENNPIEIDHTDQTKSVHWIQCSFVNLITETRYATPTLNITEKTIKPIVVFRPFIMLGPPNTLQFIRDLGFKTFDEFWNEEYDYIQDHTDRFEAVYGLIKSLLSKSNNELEEMLVAMRPVLEHNKNHLKSNFGQIFLNINKT